MSLGLDLSACVAPFLNVDLFQNSTGYIPGRLCETVGKNATTGQAIVCCLPCPMTDWVYPESFNTLGLGADWLSVVGTICCVGLLLSWAVLPVEKTGRHYLSVCLTASVLLMNMGFVIPLASNAEQCADTITPNGMESSAACAASGSLLVLGGWGSVMWAFMRSVSLHLQICWQVVVGRRFMWFAQLVGWGIPIIGIILAILLSGVSFRFGDTCHINHANSLQDFWIPLLIFSGLTLVIQFATFAYCIKVYLASFADNSASTEGSGLPSYTNSIRMTPRQAYRRVRRVIELQWRGIAIVIIIICDVIFLSIVFVFQDSTVQAVQKNGQLALPWILCLVEHKGDKNQCFSEASAFTVNEATVGAVLFLLAINGIWLAFLLGRWTMISGWIEMITKAPSRNKREFVSVDARLDDVKKDTRSYEMLSRDSGKPMVDDVVTPSVVTPLPSAAKSPQDPSGRRTPDYFGNTARYHTPQRSFSAPRPPPPQSPSWDSRETYARPTNYGEKFDDMNPLGMNRI